jgi:hypothetical protein
MTRRRTGGIVVAALLLYSAVVLLFGHLSESPIPFDAEVWKHQEDSNERLRMVSDLKPKLMGITKRQVEEMLGEPRKDVAGLCPGHEHTYLLGVVGRLGPDDGIWLCINFENDRVKDVRVVQD